MNEIETIIEVAKEVVEEAIRAGADHKQCFDMEKEAAAYLENF